MAPRSPTTKISLQELQRIIANPVTRDEDLQPFVKADEKRSGPFSPHFRLDPATVELPAAGTEGTRSALGLNFLNSIMRARRRVNFDLKIATGYDGPVIVSEGDSWFQHPLLTDTVDHLSNDYAIRSLDAAGDLLEGIAEDGEYLGGLDDTGASILLLSAGGNDALGGGNLKDHLRDFDPRVVPAEHLLPSYHALIDHALSLYDGIFRAVEGKPGVVTICHGYDYAIPDGQTWLGEPMVARGITDSAFQRAIVGVMVDGFNARLGRVAGRFPRVRLLDLRGTVGDGRWHDELHPTQEGYAAVAARFHEAIEDESTLATRGAGKKGVAKGARATTAAISVRPARRGLSLHVGLNTVDPTHYATAPDLAACVFDAEDMADLAQNAGYEVAPLLLDEAATRAAVTGGIKAAAAELRAGDIFLYSYSGHGSWMPDEDGDEVLDGQDETFCLYDGMMIDDELYALWGSFADDVRILVVSDSCHSGTNVKSVTPAAALVSGTAHAMMPAVQTRRMPQGVAGRTIRRNRQFYADLTHRPVLRPGQTPVRALNRPLRCSVQLLAGCQDNQESLDGVTNGRFTQELLKVWGSGTFEGSYEGFHRRIVRGMPPEQTPNFWAAGKPSPSFRGQRPFSI